MSSLKRFRTAGILQNKFDSENEPPRGANHAAAY